MADEKFFSSVTSENFNKALEGGLYAIRHDAQELSDEQKTQARTNIGAADTETVRQLSEEKLDKDKLNEAIDTALAQAKESGEFDGADGKDGQDGYTPVKDVDYFDGADGKDGKDGEDGKDGYTPVKGVDYFDGEDGKNGADGVGVASIVQTTTSDADGGSNIITATLTNGEKTTFTVKNGKTGGVGPAGADGFSPTASVTQTATGATISIEDKSGTTTATVTNGKDGASGVYVGETEPTNDSANVWINPYSGVAIIPTIEHNTCAIFKKVVCVGDSFTSGHIHTGEAAVGTNEDYSWPSYMARLTGNEYVNCGASGATTLTWLTMSRGLTKAKSAGVVQAYLVGLGLNDVNGVGGITLGTAADIGTDAQTYYAGMSRIIRELNAISPKAKIFIQTMASNSAPNMQHNAAIREVVAVYADTYPVYLLDLEAYLPMYKTDLILGDKINGHYTAIGYQMFAENLRVVWSEYINNHVAEFQDVYTLPYGTT